MNPHIVLMFCSVMWYLCVLMLWVWLGRSMNLFGNHSLNGWLMIGAAFVFSCVANFLLNPLAWVMAALSIHTAKAEGRPSVWRYYAPLLGFLLIAAIIASVLANIARTQKTGQWRGPVPLSAPEQPATGSNRALTVMGIMYSDHPSALVNGQVVVKGDVIDGFKVVEIRQNAVLFGDAKGIFEERVR